MFYKLEGEALDAYNKIVEETVAKAMRELGLPRDQIVIRPLRAEDIGFTAPEFLKTIAGSATYAWNNIVNTITIADNRFVKHFFSTSW